MSRSPIPLTLALFAVALVAVPAALANGRDHRAVRIQGVCTQQSTSKLKLSREDRRIEVEFQVDQNRNGVPWTVTLSRNGNPITSLTATTRAPSGSFEIHRVIAGQLGTDRITADRDPRLGRDLHRRQRHTDGQRRHRHPHGQQRRRQQRPQRNQRRRRPRPPLRRTLLTSPLTPLPDPRTAQLAPPSGRAHARSRTHAHRA